MDEEDVSDCTVATMMNFYYQLLHSILMVNLTLSSSMRIMRVKYRERWLVKINHHRTCQSDDLIYCDNNNKSNFVLFTQTITSKV